MVQLSPSHTLAVTQDTAEGEDRHGEQLDTISSPKVENLPEGLTSPQVNLEVSTAYHGYETYIEDGLICLKHKVRNLEKKKVKCLLCTSKHCRNWSSALFNLHLIYPQLKLRDYQKRLSQGEVLNKDQMVRPSF